MSGKTTKHAALALAAACLFLFLPGTARADIDPGVRAGFYQDAEAGFIGGELLWDVTREWYFNPNLEYVFVDDGDLYTVNLDFHYDFQTRQPFYLWAGAGAALISSEFDRPRGESDRETDIGLNVLGGIGFGRGQAIRPYIQGKVILSDETEAAIAVGIRFN